MQAIAGVSQELSQSLIESCHVTSRSSHSYLSSSNSEDIPVSHMANLCTMNRETVDIVLALYPHEESQLLNDINNIGLG